jgi:hypothetical protein
MQVPSGVHQELRKQVGLPVKQASRAMPSGHLPPLPRPQAMALRSFILVTLFREYLFQSHSNNNIHCSMLLLGYIVSLSA